VATPVTSLTGRPEHIYEDVYCQRGEAENLIKLHKTQLASSRTSCHSATANQIRLVLATGGLDLENDAVLVGLPLKQAAGVSRIVRKRLRCSGIELGRVAGAHLLRHSLATELVERRRPINEIADLLGHRSINTTSST